MSEPQEKKPGKRRRWVGRLVFLALLLVAGGLWARRLLFPAPPPPASQPAVTDGPLAGLRLVRRFPRLRFRRPVFLTEAPDGSGRLYVVEQHGVIRRFKNDPDTTKAEVFLDIAARVTRGGNEEGLLGLAFHPKFKTNGRLYVYYSAKQGKGMVSGGDSIVASYRRGADGAADPASEKILLRVPQPFANHNGGMVAFGPDGMLYIGLGDGGLFGDPKRNGLDPKTLLGSILRIDVDKPAGELPYGIPPDNPFADGKEGRPEVWAYGLRNPWRFSFDRKTGELWVGDVGQNKWEEVHLLKKGDNAGWRAYEGFSVYAKGNLDQAKNATPPLAAYGRGEGVSITGGYVFRSERLPALAGHYLYADFGTGSFWALKRDPGAAARLDDPFHPTAKGVSVTKFMLSGENVASFGEDAKGEVYVCSFDGGIYWIVRESPR